LISPANFLDSQPEFFKGRLDLLPKVGLTGKPRIGNKRLVFFFSFF
jgi:hypothetical protein